MINHKHGLLQQENKMVWKKQATFKHKDEVTKYIVNIPQSVATKTKKTKLGYVVYTEFAGFRKNAKLKAKHG